MIFMGLPSIMELGLMTRDIGFENWLDLSSICFFFQFYHLTVGYWVFNLVIFVALCYMVLSQSHILD